MVDGDAADSVAGAAAAAAVADTIPLAVKKQPRVYKIPVSVAKEHAVTIALRSSDTEPVKGEMARVGGDIPVMGTGSAIFGP